MPRFPPEVASDVSREPHLRIDWAEEPLDICDDGLDFHDEQNPSCRMKREEVDASAFAVSTERHLDMRFPTRGLEPGLEHCLESRMLSIKQPIQLAAASSAVDVQVDVERFTDAAQGAGILLAEDGQRPLVNPSCTPNRRRAVGMLTAHPTPSGRGLNSFGEWGFQYACRSPSSDGMRKS